MYYLSNYCSLCLARSENITSLINIELNAQQILENIIPDYSTNELIPNTEIQIPKQICDICLNSLNNIFKFKQRCLDSIATFTEYVHRLVRDYGANNFQSVTVDDIPHFKKEENIENFDFDTTESIPNLKSEICETDDGNNVQMETQNEPTSSNFESIEMVSIKVEAPEDEFYEEGAIHEETMVKEDDSLETDMPPEDLTEPGNSASVEPTNNTEILQESGETTRKLLPEKSRGRYEKELNDFAEWRKKNSDNTVLNETVVFSYVSALSKIHKASSLWTKFSMLKKALIVNGDVDISRFGKVMTFMKKQNIGFVPKKSKVLSVADCRKFILEASDDYLLSKVVLIFGLYGACRRDELLKLTIDDIEDHEKYVLVKLQNTSRTFIIPDVSEFLNPYDIYKKYAKLRPRDPGTRRFFLGYRQGKCVAQPAGMHTIGGVPKKVAAFLGLEHPENYTGHCLRRSGASMVAEASGNVCPVKHKKVVNMILSMDPRSIKLTSDDAASASSS